METERFEPLVTSKEVKTRVSQSIWFQGLFTFNKKSFPASNDTSKLFKTSFIAFPRDVFSFCVYNGYFVVNVAWRKLLSNTHTHIVQEKKHLLFVHMKRKLTQIYLSR